MKKLIIAGGSGYLGSVLADYFSTKAEVIILSRRSMASFDSTRIARFVHWDGQNLGSWVQELEGADALINLAGRSVNCRYNASNRKAIIDSRVKATQVLGQALLQLKQPPNVWLNASTATIYRHAEDRSQDEYTGEYHDDFSVQVAKQWEQAFYEASVPASVRKVALRTAIVLGKTEGVFWRLRNLVRVGLGGKQGAGSQFVSWVHELDFARAVEFLLKRPDLEGTFNIAAPSPITNTHLMRSLRETMHMPIGLPTPTWLLRLGAWLIGTETELILKSRRVVPTRLLESGFRFQFPTIQTAWRQIVGYKKAAEQKPAAEQYTLVS
ncbi:MAG: TIGR01777 family oxidoreductase [Spirosomataceae bacterium]